MSLKVPIAGPSWVEKVPVETAVCKGYGYVCVNYRVLAPLGIVCIDVLAVAAYVLAVSMALPGDPVNLSISVLTSVNFGDKTLLN